MVQPVFCNVSLRSGSAEAAATGGRHCSWTGEDCTVALAFKCTALSDFDYNTAHRRSTSGSSFRLTSRRILHTHTVLAYEYEYEYMQFLSTQKCTSINATKYSTVLHTNRAARHLDETLQDDDILYCTERICTKVQ